MGDGLDGGGAQAWVRAFTASFRERRAELDDLDRRSGDGDFGTNLLGAVERAQASLADGAGRVPGEVFAELSSAFMHAGGKSGPLLGTWFRALGRAAGTEERLGAPALAAGARRGLDAVARLGGAAPGDKTMLDAMAPAAQALEAAQGEGVAAALAAAAAAARSGAEATAELLARRGRASYVGEAARGVRDPGAVGVALFFEAGAAVTAAPDHA